jgi:uncharacterized protein YbaR (Trm112 family)
VHVGIIELLRCPAGHGESPLVASATRQTDRRIVEGVLGCPVCGAVYPIRGGIADFRPANSRGGTQRGMVPNDDAAIRLAAQLDLTEPQRLVTLFGEYASSAPALSVMFDAVVVVVNASEADEAHAAEHASVLRIADTIPLAPSILHGVAVDEAHVATLGLEAVRLLLRSRGRLVVPAVAAAPAGVEVLARDEKEWVGARTADVVALRRGSR